MARLVKGVSKDLDGFSVTRILPNQSIRMVGPFIFFDHMGPATFSPGEGIDVRPHPHIGLATITYLFDGAILHRDSLGNNLEILPGDVNWMTAGRGIVHSERESHEVKAGEHKLNGIQAWLALPAKFAEIEPSFCHYNKAALPQYNFQGAFARLIAGEAYGLTSPIKTYSPMFYLDVLIKQGRQIERPNPEQECAAYVIEGDVNIGGQAFGQGDFTIVEASESVIATTNSRVLLLGGEQWEQEPHLYWNFVSFDLERIEQAKIDWREQRFPDIPGDNHEFTPLPD